MSLTTETPILSYRGVSIAYRAPTGSVEAVRNVDLDINGLESFGLVGESGCGKTTLAMATMGYLGDSGFVSGGSISFLGRNLVDLSGEALRALRGSDIAMVYQDPMASLNPSMTVGRQLVEGPLRHGLLARNDARDRAVEMLEGVQLRNAAGLLDRYPHQLSGGQQQRVVIAMALMTQPKLILLDEPTTGLDVTVEAAVLELIATLKQRFGVTLLYISHNLGLVAQVCDRVGIMYGGELVEVGSVRDIFADPRHPYTRALLACLPGGSGGARRERLPALPGHVPAPGTRIPGCVFGPRCSFFRPGLCDAGPIPLEWSSVPDHAVRCLRSREQLDKAFAPISVAEPRLLEDEPLLTVENVSKTYSGSGSLGRLFSRDHKVRANADLSFDARHGEILAIVGESGSGKSTFAKILTGLETADAGAIRIGDTDVSRIPVRLRGPSLLKAFQMVFQNPDDTLNPSFSVGASIRRALRKAGVARADLARRAGELLAVVRLPAELATRRPNQLSGGQKQRVAIARAIASHPSVLVCDEPVSALDVSVQAAITNLLLDIQDDTRMTVVLISHDLGLVQYMADRVVVLYGGRVVQFGRTEEVYAPPHHPYTEILLSARLVPDPARRSHPIAMARRRSGPTEKGCCFAGQCPRYIGPICDDELPPVLRAGQDNRIHCHLSLEQLMEPLATMSDAAGSGLSSR